MGCTQHEKLTGATSLFRYFDATSALEMGLMSSGYLAAIVHTSCSQHTRQSGLVSLLFLCMRDVLYFVHSAEGVFTRDGEVEPEGSSPSTQLSAYGRTVASFEMLRLQLCVA